MMLRDYQLQAIHDLRRSIATGHRAPVLVAPTGSGKTAIAAEVIRSANEKGRPVLFLAPRRELIYQTVERVERHDLDYGIIMAGEEMRIMPDVQIASVPTLHVRGVQKDRISLPPASVVLVDEAHIGVGGRTQELIEHYKQHGATVIGLTATPARTDGRGLGMIYDDMVLGPSVKELTDMEYLVPARYFVGEAPDTEGVDVRGGDYVKAQLAQRTDKPKLVGDVVDNAIRIAGDRQMLVFAVNKAHSRHLCDEFRRYGIEAVHVDDSTEKEDRRAVYNGMQDGRIQAVCNVGIYTYGVDLPSVSAIVLATKTKSITRYLQMVGRGLRPAEDKSDCLVLDHADAVKEVGFVDDEMPWTLDGKEKIQERKLSLSPEPQDITCGDCGQVFRPRKTCPGCGKDMSSKAKKAIEAHEAELVEIDKRKKKKAGKEYSAEYKARFYGQLLGYARQKGYKRGWAFYAYKEKFHVGPGGQINHAPVMEPGEEVLRWCKYLNIKRAKAKQKERAAA